VCLGTTASGVAVVVKYRNIVVYVLLFAWRKCLENLRYGTSGNYLFIGRQNDTTDDDDNNFNITLLLLLPRVV